MKSKYHNIKRNGFDSKREENRYRELKLLEIAGKISGLERQHRFRLSLPHYGEDGKCFDRQCDYIADFVYYDSDGQMVVEDCKGFRTDVYMVKRKWFYEKYGIRIKET